jgi:hypothetical protein
LHNLGAIVTLLESTLTKVYKNKALDLSLESTLMKNMGGRGVMVS